MTNIGDARDALIDFLHFYAGKPDTYEVRGGSERPASPVTLGVLRALASQHNQPTDEPEQKRV